MPQPAAAASIAPMPRFVALLSLLATACAGSGVSTSVATPASARAEVTTIAPVVFGGAELHEGASAIEVPCESAAEERCNALDDDCDGRVDESASCPYDPGELHVVVAWNTDADVDLYLTEPGGTTASFQSPSAAHGLQVQHAGRGACAEGDGPARRIESARIAEGAPPGRYVVALHYLMECDTHGGPTTALVTVSVGDVVAGTWTYTLRPNERVEVVHFELR